MKALLKSQVSVFRSNTDIYVQLIDDESGKTLASASSKDKDIACAKSNKAEKVNWLVQLLHVKQLNLGIKEVVFDRGGYLYHGRVKAVAEGAREGGLQF